MKNLILGDKVELSGKNLSPQQYNYEVRRNNSEVDSIGERFESLIHDFPDMKLEYSFETGKWICKLTDVIAYESETLSELTADIQVDLWCGEINRPSKVQLEMF